MCEYKNLAKNINLEPFKKADTSASPRKYHFDDNYRRKKYIVLTTNKLSIDLKFNNGIPAFFHIINNAADLMIDVIMIITTDLEKDMLKLLNEQKMTVKFSTRLNEKIFEYKQISVFIQTVEDSPDLRSEYFSTKNVRTQENDILIVLKPNTPLVTKNTIKNMFDILSNHTPVDSGIDVLVLESSSTKASDTKISYDDFNDSNDLKNLTDLDNYAVCGFRTKKILESIVLNSSITTTMTTTKIPKLKKYLSKERFDETMSLFKTKSLRVTSSTETLADDVKRLQAEYMKKFTVEHIDKSESNTTNINLTRLIRILDQLSPAKPSSISTQESYPDALTLNKLRTHIKDVTSLIVNKKYLIVVKYEDMIVGTGSILIEDKIIHNLGKVGHIEDIVVDKSHRGIGLANLLMIKLIELAEQHKCYKIILDASDDVAPFYEKFGFRVHANSMRKNL